MEAKTYFELIDLQNPEDIFEPPLTMGFTEDELKRTVENALAHFPTPTNTHNICWEGSESCDGKWETLLWPWSTA